MIHKEEIPDSMLFAGIHPEEKESILKCLSAVEKKYEKGDIIFLAGTEIRSMGFILSGRVEISRLFSAATTLTIKTSPGIQA